MRLVVSLGTLFALLLAGFALILGSALGLRRPLPRIRKTDTHRSFRLTAVRA